MKLITFISAFYLFFTFSITAQLDSNIITQPNTLNVPNINVQKAKDLSNVGFGRYCFGFEGDGIKLDINIPVSMPLQVVMDLGKNTKGQIFIAPRAGIYHFEAKMNFYYFLTINEDFTHWHLRLYNGNNIIDETYLTNPRAPIEPKYTLMVNATVLLNKGDEIYIMYEGEGVNGTIAYTEDVSFSGFLVAELPMSEKSVIK